MPAVCSKAAAWSTPHFRLTGEGCFHLLLFVGACAAQAQRSLNNLRETASPQVTGQVPLNTKLLTKSAVHTRLIVFGGFIAFTIALLFVGGAIVAFKKGGEFALGKLVARKGEGIFWKEKLLCCGSKKATLEHVEVQNENAPAEESPQADAILEPAASTAAADKAPLLALDPEKYKEKFQEWEKKRLGEHEKFLSLRFGMLVALFVAYVSVSIGIPLMNAGTVSCGNGFFWESHMTFLSVFCITKVAELFLYSMDPTLTGQLDVLTFLFKFTTSFLGYVDGYSDSTSIVIAHSCPDSFAQDLSRYMLYTYVGGVVILQWGVVFALSTRDPSNACLMKVLHMDALASCVSLPDDKKPLWNFLHMARTFGEDIPQAIFQTLFVVKVKENYFMIVSIVIGVASSCKALLDAFNRALQAAGAYKAFEEEAAEEASESAAEDEAEEGEEADAADEATAKYKLVPGATVPRGYELIETWQEGIAAAKELGFSGDSVAHGAYQADNPNLWGSQRPKGMFRSGDNGRFHFNSGAGGNFQGTDAILVKRKVARINEEPPVWVADLDCSKFDVKGEQYGKFSMDDDPEKGPVLKIQMKSTSGDHWTETTLPVPVEIGRIANLVSGSIKMNSMTGNGAYLNIFMANPITNQEDKLWIKFDANKLRGYGKVIGKEDFGVPCATVRANVWLDLVVKIERAESRISFTVDGALIKTAKIAPGYTRVSGINLMGFNRGVTSWWANVVVSASEVLSRKTK